MYNDYYEACEAIVTKQDAIDEVERHRANVSDFLNDVGNKEEYKGSEVLYWLGY